MISKQMIGAAVGIVTAIGLGVPAWLSPGAGFIAQAQAAPVAGPTEQGCSRQEEAANKKLMERFQGPPIPSPQAYFDVMHPDYIQHNPDALRFEQLNHLTGKAAMGKLLEAMGKLSYHGPADSLGVPVMMIAECDLIMVLHQVEEPDPQNQGKTYTAFWFEMFRIKDGKLYEHWDDDRLTTPLPPYLAAPIAALKPPG